MTETLFAEFREDAGIDENYRPVSGLAVAGFLVSWLALAAFFGAVLWSVAALGIVLNLAALRHVAATSRKGAGLARAGLVISVFSLAAAVSYDWLQGLLNRQQAQRMADDWIESVLSGDIRRAHQLSLPPSRRLPDADRLEAIYAESPSLLQDLEAYEKIEAVRTVREAQGRTVAKDIDLVAQREDTYREWVDLSYNLRYDDGDEHRTVPLVLQMVRERAYGKQLPGWRVNLNPPMDPMKPPGQ
jgi:hypothetical protein